MRTIQFNTGRPYTKEGQRITATYRPHNEAEDMGGTVTFYDHDRMVDGEFDIAFECLFTPAVIMRAYDRYQAPGTARSRQDGLQRGGCNTVYAEAQPEAAPAPVLGKIKVDPKWLAACGREALADTWLDVVKVAQTADGPYYHVTLPNRGNQGIPWVVAGWRTVALLGLDAPHGLTEARKQQAHTRLAQAEKALGRLSEGQRRDLIADSFPGWRRATVNEAANTYTPVSQLVGIWPGDRVRVATEFGTGPIVEVTVLALGEHKGKPVIEYDDGASHTNRWAYLTQVLA